MAFVSQLDTYALTTLAKGLYELGLTTDGGTVDNYVEQLINKASAIIESSLHRKLKARLHIKERHNGKGQDSLYFKEYPVLAINLDNLVWDETEKTLTRADGGSFIDDGFVAGDKVLVQNSDSNSGLLTIATDGVAALVLTFDDDITTDADDDNVILSRFRELWIDDTEIDEDDYEVLDDHIYYNAGFSKGHGNIRITYYAGYTTIPADIEAKCLELVKMAYDKNKGIKTEKIGPYSITYFDNKAEIITDIQNDLVKYINVGY